MLQATIRRVTGLAALTLGFVACASGPKPHRAMDPALAVTQEVNGRSVIAQEEVFIPVRGATGFSTGSDGLLIQLLDRLIVGDINSARSMAANQLIEPLLEVTADFDFRKEYWRALDAELAASPWIRLDDFDETALPARLMVDHGTHKGLLVMGTVYHLSRNALVLVVQTHVKYYAPREEEPTYFGYLTYFSDQVGDTGGDAAVAGWAADKGQAYRAALEESVSVTMKMLRMELLGASVSSGREAGEAVEMRYRCPIRDSKVVLRGTLLETSGERVLVRAENGNLHSLSLAMTGDER